MIRTDISVNSISKYGDKLLRDIPVRRFGKPEDLAKVIVFMASDAADYVNGTHFEVVAANVAYKIRGMDTMDK